MALRRSLLDRRLPLGSSAEASRPRMSRLAKNSCSWSLIRSQGGLPSDHVEAAPANTSGNSSGQWKKRCSGRARAPRHAWMPARAQRSGHVVAWSAPSRARAPTSSLREEGGGPEIAGRRRRRKSASCSAELVRSAASFGDAGGVASSSSAARARATRPIAGLAARGPPPNRPSVSCPLASRLLRRLSVARRSLSSPVSGL